MSQENKQNIGTIIRNVGIGVAIGAILMLIFFGGMRYQKKISTVAEQYLQNQVEVAQQEADKWKAKYKSTLEEKTTLLLNVDSLEFEINKLKKKYAKKIVAVKSYTNPELEQFFADRYGD